MVVEFLNKFQDPISIPKIPKVASPRARFFLRRFFTLRESLFLDRGSWNVRIGEKSTLKGVAKRKWGHESGHDTRETIGADSRVS